MPTAPSPPLLTGYGAYASQGECEVPPLRAGLYDSASAPPVGAGAAPTSVDPSTYPSPSSPTPATCSPAIQAWLWGRVGNASSPCPHLQPAWRWEDPLAWGAAGVPAPNTSVTLPPNVRMLITQCSFASSGSASFASITIPASSTLVFDDAALSLMVGIISVQGNLSAGGPNCRLQSKLAITFSPLPGVDVGSMGEWVAKTQM